MSDSLCLEPEYPFVLHFSLDAASAAAEKEDGISEMDVGIIPQELACGNIHAFACVPVAQQTLKFRIGRPKSIHGAIEFAFTCIYLNDWIIKV
ncbi:hypothetical protein [Cupriavidus sp. UYPR2.512]|uniref:hypothetical protein n=1 Tax=Cupriavidus sp. UYPR2.512 TaxID=1080187 RepID=UPI00038287CB|nr:hypothetical protein [Cupriavidus sp. UYPR2.512]UIF89432.1 hypothetical protein KAF44_29625 [Cupriavidus necator]